MSTYGTHDVPTHRAPTHRLRTATAVAVTGLLAVGAWNLGTVLYRTHHVPAALHTTQAQLGAQLDQAFGQAKTGARPQPALPGGAIARLWLPRLGLNWVVVEGVSLDDIRWAPGHYPDSAQPGAVGNFALAGHRSPGIFLDLDRLKPGDPIVVQTAGNWFVYRTTSMRATPPDAFAEVSPTPPGFRSGSRLLTLTTCISATANDRRYIVHAVLAHTSPHAQPPPELETTR